MNNIESLVQKIRNEISEETLVEWYILIEYYLEFLKYKLKN